MTNKDITLIATIGSSPAVLTEAIYALYHKGLWPVKEIVIVTTSHGASHIKNGLYGENKVWVKLCDELKIDHYSIRIPLIDEIRGVVGKDGKELEDIRNSEDDRTTAEYIQKVVKQYTSDKGKRVFGLLSGGRKTMGSHLMSAMQIFGRRDDKLIHLLVSEPFERIKDFYFPSNETYSISVRTGNGFHSQQFNGKDAKIDLIDIPFIRLRPFLETQIDYSADYNELLAIADEKLMTRSEYPIFDLHIHLNGSESRLYINGTENACKMEPRQISMLAFFVWMNMNQGVSYDIRWLDVIRDEDLREALHIFYRTVKEGNYASIRDKYRNSNIQDFRDQDEWLEYEYWHNEDNKPLKRSFSKNRTVLCNSISSFLEESGLGDIKLEHIFERVATAARF